MVSPGPKEASAMPSCRIHDLVWAVGNLERGSDDLRECGSPFRLTRRTNRIAIYRWVSRRLEFQQDCACVSTEHYDSINYGLGSSCSYFAPLFPEPGDL